MQIGLTATPCVAEIEAFGDEEDKLFVRDTLRFFEVEQADLHLQAERRHPRWLPRPVSDLQGQDRQDRRRRRLRGQAQRTGLVGDGCRDPRRVRADCSPRPTRIIIDPAALERRFTIPERNRAIVREFRQVLDNGYHRRKGMLRKPLIGKTIVFAVNKRHAETLAQLFDAEFADKKPRPMSLCRLCGVRHGRRRHPRRHEQDHAASRRSRSRRFSSR